MARLGQTRVESEPARQRRDSLQRWHGNVAFAGRSAAGSGSTGMSAQSGQTAFRPHRDRGAPARSRHDRAVARARADARDDHAQVAGASLHRRHRGVYSLGGRRSRPRRPRSPRCSACGPGSALSRLSAAEHWAVSRFPAPLIEVVSPRRRKVAGARVHHCRTLSRARRHRPPRHPDHDGAPAVRGPRRRPDAAPAGERDPRGRVPRALRRARDPRRHGAHQRAPQPRGARAGDGAAPHGQRGHEERRGGRLPAARPAGAAREHAPARPRGGLPLAGAGVVVEVDGIHGLPWTVADDDGRDAALTAAGYTVLRFSARDVYERRDAVTARTAAALASSPGLRHAA